MKKYTGELAKPLDPMPGFGAVPSKTSGDRVSEVYSQQFRRLFDHFGIDCNNPSLWVQLSLALAQAHVPGFRHRKKAGAKKQWDVFKLLQLQRDVDAMIEQKGQRSRYGVSWVCAQLKDQEPWKSLTDGKGNPKEVLRRNYHYANKLTNSVGRLTARVKK